MVTLWNFKINSARDSASLCGCCRFKCLEEASDLISDDHQRIMGRASLANKKKSPAQALREESLAGIGFANTLGGATSAKS